MISNSQDNRIKDSWVKRNQHHIIFGSLIGFIGLMTFFGWLADQQIRGNFIP